MLLSQEIDGFGFALACDFLKELGFINFAKPDVHVKAIVKGLNLSLQGANDYTVFKAVARIAASCGTTPYDVDKLFWLVGSGRFYAHPSIGRRGRVASNRDRFIRGAAKALGPA
jgi:thermostable 8-oxoguanine DNA glycosylase